MTAIHLKTSTTVQYDVSVMPWWLACMDLWKCFGFHPCGDTLYICVCFSITYYVYGILTNH